MNKFKRTSGFLLVLLIVILSIPGMSENNNIIPQAVAASATLHVSSQDTSGNIKTGFYMILKQAGTTVATGFTPADFTLNSGVQYTLTARGFGSYVFDHWLDTGSTVNPRTVSISTNTQLTAVYRIVTISLNPSSGPTGTTVTVTGKNFAANSGITISYDGSAITTTPTTITTDSTGGFTGSITVPSSGAGPHTVKATDAAAHTAPSQFTVTTPSIALNPSSGPTGATVNISGSNFVPNSGIMISYDGSAITSTPTTITATSTGSFTGSITIPSSSAAGPHAVKARDASSNSASAQFTVPSVAIYKIQSGLVATDSLTSGNLSNWDLYGTAVQENAPHSGTEDASGLHIGVLAPNADTWAVYFARSPLTTAHLWHAKVTLPVARPISGAVDDYLYVQQEMFQYPRIDAMGCGASLYAGKVNWIIVWQHGNDKDVTFSQDVYSNASASQPTTRDCTLVTNGNSTLKAYIDGTQVFSSTSMNLDMPEPFQSYLELVTDSVTPSTGNNFTGTFTNYYATTGDSIKVINVGAGSLVRVINTTSGNILGSSSAFSNGTAFVDVGKYNMPINAYVATFDSTGANILASTSSAAGIYGGDVFNVGNSTAPQTTITVNSFDTTTGTPIKGVYTTISTGQTKVAAGYTPLFYSGAREAEYTITPQNYGIHNFDHWDDGSKFKVRIIDPTTSNVNLTANYIDGHATATKITPGSLTIQAGNQIAFNATVTDKFSSPTTPVGTVTFDDDNAGGSFNSTVCTLDGITASCTTTYTTPTLAPKYPVTVTGRYLPSSTDTTHLGSYGDSSLTVVKSP